MTKYHWWKFDRRDPLWVGFRMVAEPFIVLPAALVAIAFVIWVLV